MEMLRWVKTRIPPILQTILKIPGPKGGAKARGTLQAIGKRLPKRVRKAANRAVEILQRTEIRHRKPDAKGAPNRRRESAPLPPFHRLGMPISKTIKRWLLLAARRAGLPSRNFVNLSVRLMAVDNAK